MLRQMALARAWGGQPVEAVVMDAGHGLIYLGRPDLLEALESGESLPVGFPAEDVFAHESGLLRDLEEAFHTKDTDRLRQLWREAKPLGRGEKGVRNSA